MEVGSSSIEQSLTTRYSRWVREALDELPDNFTITDPSISGHPIVYASRGFLKMSGYSSPEVIGSNGRIFQGPATDRRSVMAIREAVRGERAVEVSIVNHRKDGSPFWVLFQMRPVFGEEDGRVTHFVAVQVPILGSFGEDESRVSGLAFGSCRREMGLDGLVELGRVLDLDLDSDSDSHDREFSIEESCEASDQEKHRAATSIHSIISVLTHYSELTGKLVSVKRHAILGIGLLAPSLNISLGRIKQSFVLTDPHLHNTPIVYASDAFLNLTGYARREILGRNCSFLSGEDTDPTTLSQIKESIQDEKACTVRILNYRKDKSSFWNLRHVSPVRNATGKVAYFVDVQGGEGCKSRDGTGLSAEMRQRSVVGAVKVAVRSLSIGAGASSS